MLILLENQLLAELFFLFFCDPFRQLTDKLCGSSFNLVKLKLPKAMDRLFFNNFPITRLLMLDQLLVTA